MTTKTKSISQKKIIRLTNNEICLGLHTQDTYREIKWSTKRRGRPLPRRNSIGRSRFPVFIRREEVRESDFTVQGLALLAFPHIAA